MGNRKAAGEPLDRVVAEVILMRIASGAWPVDRSLPPVRSLARDLGVSLTTAVKALRRTSRRGLVTIRPRQGVTLREGAAARARDLLARRARRPRVRRVGVLVPEAFMPLAGNPAYRDLVGAVVQVADRGGLSAEVVSCPPRQAEATCARVLRGGLVAVTCVGFYGQEYPVLLEALYNRGVPVTAFNRYISTPPIPSVHVDDYGAGREIARRLAELGHRNMCLVTHLSGYNRERSARVAGWVDFLNERGLVRECILPVYVIPCWGRLPDYGPAFAETLRRPGRPTALVFAHGPWGASFLTDPRFRNLAVPDELSLATFESLPEDVRRTVEPEVTTVQVDYRRTGECVVEQLVRMLDGEERPPDIRVPLYFTMTESVGPPPADSP